MAVCFFRLIIYFSGWAPNSKKTNEFVVDWGSVRIFFTHFNCSLSSSSISDLFILLHTWLLNVFVDHYCLVVRWAYINSAEPYISQYDTNYLIEPKGAFTRRDNCLRDRSLARLSLNYSYYYAILRSPEISEISETKLNSSYFFRRSPTNSQSKRVIKIIFNNNQSKRVAREEILSERVPSVYVTSRRRHE